MYGNILASCSYDRRVIVWKEENGTWEKTYEYTGHDSSGTGSGTGPRDWARGMIQGVGVNLSVVRKKVSVTEMRIKEWRGLSHSMIRTRVSCRVA